MQKIIQEMQDMANACEFMQIDSEAVAAKLREWAGQMETATRVAELWDREEALNMALKDLPTTAYYFEAYEERDGCFPSYYRHADIFEPYTGPGAGAAWPVPRNIKPLVLKEAVEAAFVQLRKTTVEECIKFVESGVFLTNDSPAARMAKECAKEMRKQIS
jgi:hypothetical protein